MIYEFRTYTLKPGSVAEVEKRFGAGYEHRKTFSPLTAFWHTEIGPLNEIIHVWGYKDQAERTQVRAEAAKPGVWPPNTSEFIVKMRSEIVHPFPFVPELDPGKMGPIFELRYYTIKPGTLPDIIKRWESKIQERTKFSPLALAGHLEHGRPTATCTSGRTRASTTAGDPGEGARRGRVAAAGRRRRAADAGQQDHAAGGVLARPVAQDGRRGPPRPPPLRSRPAPAAGAPGPAARLRARELPRREVRASAPRPSPTARPRSA